MSNILPRTLHQHLHRRQQRYGIPSRRLVAEPLQGSELLADEVLLLARHTQAAWTIVFDGPRPPDTRAHTTASPSSTPATAAAIGADNYIVQLVRSLPHPADALVYTSDATLRARILALGAHVIGAAPSSRKSPPQTPADTRATAGALLPKSPQPDSSMGIPTCHHHPAAWNPDEDEGSRKA